MESVILTGASGFIGKHCLKPLLNAGFRVEAVCHTQIPADRFRHEQLRWHKADLLDAEQSSRLISSLEASHMLHLAWYAEPGKFWNSELNKNWLEAGMHMFSAFAEAGGKRFVGAGSCAEYDWSQGGVLKEDKTPLKPATIYGTCKAELFENLKKAAKKHKVEFAWGRIFWLYGPGEDERRLVPYIITSLLTNKEAKCSSGMQERDFLFVEDLARAFTMLVQSHLQGAVNIGSGKALSVRNLAETIARILQKENLLKLGALPNAENEPPLVLADTHRLEKELAFRPDYDLEEGLQICLEWWKNRQYSMI